MKYEKGVSGNPAGRPKGAVSKELGLLRGKSQDVINVVTEQALAGCLQSQKLIVERVVPALKPVEPVVSLDDYPSTGSFSDRALFLLDAIACGKVSVAQGEIMVNLLFKLFEAQEKDVLIARLNAQAADDRKFDELLGRLPGIMESVS